MSALTEESYKQLMQRMQVKPKRGEKERMESLIHQSKAVGAENFDPREYYSDTREIEGRGLCGLEVFMHTTGIVWGIDEYSKAGRWCYEHHADAVEAFAAWNGVGDPPGPWIKYKGECERLGPGAVGEFA